jgi:hypothetical protein
MWTRDGNISCDGCEDVFDCPGPRVEVTAAARRHQWHVYSGDSVTGQRLESALCPRCLNRKKSDPPPPVLPGDVPLF